MLRGKILKSLHVCIHFDDAASWATISHWKFHFKNSRAIIYFFDEFGWKKLKICRFLWKIKKVPSLKKVLCAGFHFMVLIYILQSSSSSSKKGFFCQRLQAKKMKFLCFTTEFPRLQIFFNSTTLSLSTKAFLILRTENIRWFWMRKRNKLKWNFISNLINWFTSN